MAKLYSYYTLCPLIDQQNLLGVERDSENGCAIVTLGRNIVIRYKLQDLKEMNSWTSEDRLTTQVIYDGTTGQYVAIFNEKKIRLWYAEDTDLNSIKSYKFRSSLHTILTHEDCPPILVCKNGATASIKWAIENRKSWNKEGILNATEKIINCYLIRTSNKISLCILTEKEGTHTCVIVRLNSKTYSEEVDSLQRIHLKRHSEELVGHTVLQAKNKAYLVTLWSYGRLYSHPLMEISNENSTLIGIINNINTKYPVIMTALNETTLAIYGADISDEGAILMIYNIKFKLIQDAQKLKLYTKDAKLWKIEDKLLLAANKHLAIAPYHLAPQTMISCFVSSTRLKDDEEDTEDNDIVVIRESTVPAWRKTKTIKNAISANQKVQKPPMKLSKQIKDYINEGLGDAAIQEILIPQLIESKDIQGIIWYLDEYRNLTEKLLIDLLIFSLRSPNETFLPMQNGVTDNVSTKKLHSRNDLLDRLLSLTSDTSYLGQLNFNEILQLLQYLIEKLEENISEEVVHQPSDEQLYECCKSILDSQYPKYILSRDKKNLSNLSQVLEDHWHVYKSMENLRPVLSCIINGRSPKLLQKNRNKFYTIEEIKLY